MPKFRSGFCMTQTRWSRHRGILPTESLYWTINHKLSDYDGEAFRPMFPSKRFYHGIFYACFCIPNFHVVVSNPRKICFPSACEIFASASRDK